MVSSGAGERPRGSHPISLASYSIPRSVACGSRGWSRTSSARVREQGNLGGWPRNAYSASRTAVNAFTTHPRSRARARPAPDQGQRRAPRLVRTRIGGSSASRDVKQGASGIAWAATPRSQRAERRLLPRSKSIEVVAPGQTPGNGSRDRERVPGLLNVDEHHLAVERSRPRGSSLHHRLLALRANV